MFVYLVSCWIYIFTLFSFGLYTVRKPSTIAASDISKEPDNQPGEIFAATPESLFVVSLYEYHEYHVVPTPTLQAARQG